MAAYQNNCDGTCPVPQNGATQGQQFSPWQPNYGAMNLPPAPASVGVESKLHMPPGAPSVSREELMKFLSVDTNGTIHFNANVGADMPGFRYACVRANGMYNSNMEEHTMYCQSGNQRWDTTSTRTPDSYGDYTVETSRAGNARNIHVQLNSGVEAFRLDIGGNTFIIKRSEILGQHSAPARTPPTQATAERDAQGWTSVGEPSMPPPTRPATRAPGGSSAPSTSPRDLARTDAQQAQLQGAVNAAANLGNLLGAEPEPTLAQRLVGIVERIEARVKPDASGHLPPLPDGAAVRSLAQIALLRETVKNGLANDPTELKLALDSLTRSEKYLQQQPTGQAPVADAAPASTAPAATTPAATPAASAPALGAGPIAVPSSMGGAASSEPAGLGGVPASAAPSAEPAGLGGVPAGEVPINTPAPSSAPAVGPTVATPANLGGVSSTPADPAQLGGVAAPADLGGVPAGGTPAASNPTTTAHMPENGIPFPQVPHAEVPLNSQTGGLATPSGGPAAAAEASATPAATTTPEQDAERQERLAQRNRRAEIIIKDYYAPTASYGGYFNFNYNPTRQQDAFSSDHAITNPTVANDLLSGAQALSEDARLSSYEPVRIQNEHGIFFCFFGKDGSVNIVDRASLASQKQEDYDRSFEGQLRGESGFGSWSLTKEERDFRRFTKIETDGSIKQVWATKFNEEGKPTDAVWSAYEPERVIRDTAKNNSSGPWFSAYDLDNEEYHGIPAEADGPRLQR